MTDVVPIVTTTAHLLIQDPSLKGIEVDIEGLGAADPADGEMLRIVFQNLLLNGAHAMKGRGTIKVAVNIRDTTPDRVFGRRARYSPGDSWQDLHASSRPNRAGPDSGFRPQSD